MNLLTEIEARVLACLIEKSIATPDYYPLTLNSLVAACNQKSNRDPEMQLDERTVSNALDTLRFTHTLVVQVSEAGSRVPKFKHDIGQHLPHTPEITAILCELMLRGPQTVGEIKTHAKRLFAFASLVDVNDILKELCSGEAPLVTQLPPGPGKREKRYAHLLCGPVDEAIAYAAEASVVSQHHHNLPSAPSRVDALEEDVTTLKQDVAKLRLEIEELKRQLGA